jgi:hypothetical protein
MNFWPVTEVRASLFTKALYRNLFKRENVRLTFLEARKYVAQELGEAGHLTGIARSSSERRCIETPA